MLARPSLAWGTALRLAPCSDLGHMQPLPQPTTTAGGQTALPSRREEDDCRWGEMEEKMG